MSFTEFETNHQSVQCDCKNTVCFVCFLSGDDD